MFSKSKNEVKYLAIKELHEEEKYSIRWMCKQLDIRRSSYYKWLNRPISKNEKEDVKLSETIMDYHQKYGGILGYRRMRLFINRNNNKHYNIKRIHRIMSILGIHSTIRRSRTCCTVANKADQKAENVLHREFEASKPNEKWTTDVTEFKVPHSTEKIYLSAFLDLYDRSIIAWSISNRNDNALILDTFNQAINQNPDAHPLFHSDRGFQYTSPVFQNKLKAQGMTQSMSRVACCLDNGPMEGLWGIIKTEMYKMYDIHNKESLIEAIDKYIEFYNYQRYQSRFDSKTPMEVREEAINKEEPKHYPIVFNPRIAKYKESLKIKTQSA